MGGRRSEITTGRTYFAILDADEKDFISSLDLAKQKLNELIIKNAETKMNKA